jgi:hypothetical protein
LFPVVVAALRSGAGFAVLLCLAATLLGQRLWP